MKINVLRDSRAKLSILGRVYNVAVTRLEDPLLNRSVMMAYQRKSSWWRSLVRRFHRGRFIGWSRAEMKNPLHNEIDLSAYWMPFTGNRAFKNEPRLMQSAKGLYYRT
ncbi:MAG: hypothetical protein Ct9H300mP8_13370 [Gammaproteobacteria bacterium]|nr:MAG: hypothetical protein Ct9H300mP8_13370 [Gammaproteobacteria bacterium]